MNNIIKKHKFLKLIKKIQTQEGLEDWNFKNIDENFDYKARGLDQIPVAVTDRNSKTIFFDTGYDFNILNAVLLHEVAHVKDKSWNKKEPHDENWAIEYTSLVIEYMKVR